MVITALRPRACSSSNLFRACFSTTAKSKLAPRDRAISSPRRKSCAAQKRKTHFHQKPLAIGFRRRYPSATFRCCSWPGKLCRRVLESLKTRKSVEELMVNLTQLRSDTPGADNVIHFNNAGAALMPRTRYRHLLQRKQMDPNSFNLAKRPHHLRTTIPDWLVTIPFGTGRLTQGRTEQ